MMFLGLKWSLYMSKGSRVIISIDVATDKVIESCCELFNSNFQKVIEEREIRIYPSRMKKYLNNSDIICVYDEQLLVGYMIIEKMIDSLVWIKQIVVAKEYREIGVATQLVKQIVEYRYIGIITNNPIMIKIIKSLGYIINYKQGICASLFENASFINMIDLYNVEKIVKEDSFLGVLTHLKNTQEISGDIDCSPLQPIKEGYEWLAMFEKNN